ncbi:hypothetical protein RCL1_008530 [Eukaryota sp. TZLM3-RCL]
MTLPKITELKELLMKSDKSVKFREDVAVVEEITTQESENIEKEEETDEHDILGMSTAHPQKEVEFEPRVSIPPTIPYITPQMELSRAKNTTLHSVINTWTRKSKEPNLFEKVEYREKCAKRNQLVIKDMRVKIEEWSSEIVYVDTVQHIKIYNFNDYFSISENEEFKVSMKKHQKNQYMYYPKYVISRFGLLWKFVRFQETAEELSKMLPGSSWNEIQPYQFKMNEELVQLPVAIWTFGKNFIVYDRDRAMELFLFMKDHCKGDVKFLLVPKGDQYKQQVMRWFKENNLSTLKAEFTANLSCLKD